MFRLNDMNRTFAEVPDEITQYTCKPLSFLSLFLLSGFPLTYRLVVLDIENDRYALPHWQTFLKYRVVVTACMDASIILGADLGNLGLMDMEDDMMSSLHPHSGSTRRSLVRPHWTHLIIDEVSRLQKLTSFSLSLLILLFDLGDADLSCLFRLRKGANRSS
jgi:hypothetical protein